MSQTHWYLFYLFSIILLQVSVHHFGPAGQALLVKSVPSNIKFPVKRLCVLWHSLQIKMIPVVPDFC
jgi:hypothetical protein